MEIVAKSEKRTLRSAVFWAVLWLAAWLPALAGCQSKPFADVRSAAGAVKQRGPVSVPARAETVTSTATLPLPAGTRVEVANPASAVEQGGGTSQGGRLSAPPALSVILPEPAVLTVQTVQDRVSGPQSFAPPSPPSPVEIAAGKAAWLYRLGLLIGAAVGVFGLVRGWDFVMYGGAAVAAACGFAMFAESHPVLFFVIGGGIVLAVVGPLLWHLKLKHRPEAANDGAPSV